MDAFDSFISARLTKRAASEDELLKIKVNYFEDRVRSIIETLTNDPGSDLSFGRFLKEKEVSIVTVRRAFNVDSMLLKPVATFPENSLHLSHDLAKQLVPQTFISASSSLAGISSKYVDPIKDENGCVYLSGVYSTAGGATEDKKNSPKFKDRIDVAFDRFQNQEPRTFGASSTCFFAAKVRPFNGKAKGQPRGFRIAQIAALYFAAGTDFAAKSWKEAHALCRSMFEENDRIHELEENLFVLEGHELTASLQPLFLDEGIAPADKIAFAVEKLRQLLKRHLHSHYPDPHPEEHKTSVHFVSLAYEVPDREKKGEVVPTFQVYPHEYRRDLAYGSFLIGHPSRLSISKYLLRKYLREKRTENGDRMEFLISTQSFNRIFPQSVVVNDSFANDMFSSIDAIVAKSRREKREGIELLVGGKSDQVYLSRISDGYEDLIWNALNVDVAYKSLPSDLQGQESAPVAPTNSILAFIIEGHDVDAVGGGKERIVYRQLPRAILAIESTHSEMLSERERDSMRQIAKSFSHLVRHIFHDNTLLDYRRQLSTAYEDYVPHQGADDHGASLGERLILSAMSIDVALLEKIRNAAKDDPFFENVIDEINSIYTRVFAGTAYDDDDMTRDELVKERIELRFERAVTYLLESSIPSQEAVDFLEACPRNFAWAGYAPSLAQALGDRADHRPPQFTLMSPGFSASGLYMAIVEGEIRQVAKLSRVDRLVKERENYRQHVRYKVLVAARSPANAFAFDSTGKSGKEAGAFDKKIFIPGEKYSEECYGVLVADLASSKKLDPTKSDTSNEQTDGNVPEVATFLDRVVGVVDSSREGPFYDVSQSLRALFENNFGHWVSTTVPGNNKVIPQLRAAFRLDYETKLKRQLTEEYQAPSPRVKSDGGKTDIPQPPTRSREDLWWTELAFSRLGEGVEHSIVEHERGLFPLELSETECAKSEHERICMSPKEIAAFCCDYMVRKAGLNSEDKKQLLCIAHRDLNAQNIVWAGPIQSYMMIDFEHTGKGYWGMDQARLAVNTVVDFLSKAANPEAAGNHFVEVANAANFIVEAWRSYRTHKAWTLFWGILPKIHHLVVRKCPPQAKS